MSSQKNESVVYLGVDMGINDATRAKIHHAILEILDDGAFGVVVGNKNCRKLLRKKFPDLTKDAYFEVRDKMVEEGIIKKDRGNGGSIYKPDGNGGKPSQTLKMIKSHKQIMAVLMKNENDKEPKFLGRSILKWEDSEFDRAIHEHYIGVSSNHRAGKSDTYIGCQHCLQPLVISGISGKTGERTFKHRNKSGPCVFKSDAKSKEQTYAEMYDGGVVSEEHEEVVKHICESLMARHSTVDLRQPGEVPALECMPSLNIKPQFFQDGSYDINRRPDISFSFVFKDGSIENWAIEVQRSKIMDDDIISRTEDYRSNGINLLWVMLSDLASSPRSRAATALQSIHRGCQHTLSGDAFSKTAIDKVLQFYVTAYEGLEFEDAEEDEREDYKGARVVYDEIHKFPDDFKSVNGHVFGYDHTTKGILDTAKERRKCAIAAFNLGRGYFPCSKQGSKLRSDSVSSAIMKINDRALKEIEADHSFYRPTASSKVWRTLSVMLSVLLRKFKDPVANITASYEADEFWIFNYKPKENLYTQIIADFYLRSGYKTSEAKNIFDPLLFQKEMSKLDHIERTIIEYIFPELYNDAIRSQLGSVERIPDWCC